ncbi:MAG: MliC family protein [Paracoccaceae bacterium]
MTISVRALVPAAVAIAGPAHAELEISTASYRCERGVIVPATYLTTEDDAAVVIQAEGCQITLSRTPSASGVRYVWPSDGSGYVWWTKGDEATLGWIDAGHSEEITLYAACHAQ